MEVKLTREEVEELILEGLAARHPTLPPIREITYHSYGVERPRVWWQHATIQLAELEASALPAPEQRDMENSSGVAVTFLQDELEKLRREETQHAAQTTPQP